MLKTKLDNVKKRKSEEKIRALQDVQGPPLGIDIMYLVLADRNMQVRFGLKVVWGS